MALIATYDMVLGPSDIVDHTGIRTLVDSAFDRSIPLWISANPPEATGSGPSRVTWLVRSFGRLRLRLG